MRLTMTFKKWRNCDLKESLKDFLTILTFAHLDTAKPVPSEAQIVEHVRDKPILDAIFSLPWFINFQKFSWRKIEI